jgi:hypothetical protein
MDTIGITIAAVAGWFVREIASFISRRFAARVGKVGYIRDGCGFFAIAELEDGTRQEVSVRDPRQTFRDAMSYRFSVRGQLFNQSETPRLIRDVQLEFLHPTREPLSARNPDVIVDGQRVKAFSVAANGLMALRIELDIAAQLLEKGFAQTIPRNPDVGEGWQNASIRGQ